MEARWRLSQGLLVLPQKLAQRKLGIDPWDLTFLPTQRQHQISRASRVHRYDEVCTGGVLEKYDSSVDFPPPHLTSPHTPLASLYTRHPTTPHSTPTGPTRRSAPHPPPSSPCSTTDPAGRMAGRRGCAAACGAAGRLARAEGLPLPLRCRRMACRCR
jgi:hypothetical protein